MVGSAGLLIKSAPGDARRALPAACALLLLALIGVVLSAPMAAIWVKAFADPFFHSTSAGAAVSVLAFGAAVAARLAFGGRALTRTGQRRAAVVLVAGIVVGNAANLWAHLALAQAQEFAPVAAFHHWSGEQNTYSFVLHSHTGKAAIDWLLSGLLERIAPSWDIGRGLAAALPGWVAAVCAGSMVAALLAALALVPAIAARGGAPAWLFGFCSLSCIKTVADGGPLTYRFGLALCALVLLLASHGGASRRIVRAAAAAGALLLAGYGVLWGLVADEPGVQALASLASTAALLGLLLCWGLRSSGWPRRPWLKGVGALCALALLADLVLALLATPGALLLPLEDGMQATVCDLRTLRCATRDVGGQRALDVYTQAGDDPLKPRRTLIAPATTPAQAGAQTGMTIAVRPLRTAAPVAGAGELISVLPVRQLGHSGNVLVELRSARLPAIFGPTPGVYSARNYHVFLHLAAAQLRAQGLQEFAFSPLRHEAAARAFGLH